VTNIFEYKSYVHSNESDCLVTDGSDSVHPASVPVECAFSLWRFNIKNHKYRIQV